jgi:hypothetical protein
MCLRAVFVRSNREVEGPRRSARLEPRVHTAFQHPRRHYRPSRPLRRLLDVSRSKLDGCPIRHHLIELIHFSIGNCNASVCPVD